jgi:hypothetical protein
LHPSDSLSSHPDRILVEHIGHNIFNTRFLVEFGSKRFNDHPPIQDPLQLDVTIYQVFVISENADG